MGKSAIEWTEQTWNPVVGCSIVSPGCTNCYAMKMAARIEAMGNQPRYAGTTKKVNGNAIWTGLLSRAPDSALLAPLKRKKPTTYFVNSMGDLFHEDCADEWIDRVFAVMALSPQHTFQVLTKRAARMRDYLAARNGMGNAQICDAINRIPAPLGNRHGALEMPLPNVWLGVSAERQQEADERIPLLLQTPAAVRFISAEPLLGAIDLTRLSAPKDPEEPEAEWLFDALATGDMYEQRFKNSFGEVWFDSGDGPYRETKLDWVIVGGESGPNARPMHPAWARDLRDQCASAGVSFFFKQWGEHVHATQCDLRADMPWTEVWIDRDTVVARVGKKVAGRHLDGALHDAMPLAASARMKEPAHTPAHSPKP